MEYQREKAARELYELAKQRDYERLMSDIKKRVPTNPEDVWKLQKFLNEQAKEFDRVYKFRYGYILETFVYLVRKGILAKEDLQPLGEEKFLYINDILKILTVDNLTQIYQIKILLEGTKPTFYRTIEISENATFSDLHMVIQIAFDWYNAHLHEFRKNDLLISDPEFYDDAMYEFEEDEELVDENKIQISEILQSPKDKLKYLYDFGDSWELSISLEKIIGANEGVVYPRCIRGKRCAPPEDVGGIWGFEEFKEVMADPHNEEYESYKEWYGGNFDPDFVDFENINEQLQSYAKGEFDIDED